jgi:adenosylcobinamide kinase/adenosylcobinamide-phosphate guanylyltransferase
MGIVPDNELARRFRDLAGWMNQNFAELAGTVIFAISGIPLYLKKGSYEDFAN